MPRLPQAIAILELRRPLERVAAAFLGERLDGLRVIGDRAIVVAMELEQQRRRHRHVVLERLLIASICTSSSSSMRATGTPSWIVAITVSTAPFIESNAQIAAATASGTGAASA